MLRKKREQTIRILVASPDPAVPAALAATTMERSGRQRVHIDVVEAISTRVAYDNLAGCSLAIVDAEHLIPSPGVTPKMFTQALARSGIPVVSGLEFTSRPAAWMERATAAVGLLDALPPQVVMLTGYAGGTGKTTLALNLARYASGTLRLPVAVIEVAFGTGACRALTDPTLPDLYDVLTQGQAPGTWQATTGCPITLLPMDYEAARLLLNRSAEVLDLAGQIVADHVLTIIDAAGANPFRPILQQIAARVLVVADPRPDAIANAGTMLKDLAGAAQDPPLQAGVLLNKVDGLGDRLALSGAWRSFGTHAACKLPYTGHPDEDPRLAQELLPVIYPGWQPKT
jgi:MinD-like ATPase involved in chromosome partitioning or flagellar assembly